MPDRLDHRVRQARARSLGRMPVPFVLARPVAGHREDRELAQARLQAGLVAQQGAQRLYAVRKLGIVHERHEEVGHRAARPAPNRVADPALVRPVQLLGAGQRQPACGHAAPRSSPAASRSAIGGTNCRSVSQGKKIQVSWLTSVTKVCASPRPAGLV